MHESLTVALGARSYDIQIGDRLLYESGPAIAQHIQSDFVIIITDENVAKFYLHRLTGALDEQKIRCRTIIVKPGEASKSLSVFSELLENILEQQPNRRTTLIALGGGVVGDLAGFAASVLLRGLEFIQIPTTLLSQVDSSVGGKTGINSRFGKNLIGSFHQPRLVLADVSTLATLPKRELMAGYAEMLKYALIGDAAFFGWLEKNAAAMLAGDKALMAQAIATCCKAKAAIVAADEKESGVRALLNFGHTFGHALETQTGYSDQLLHGEAVAIGMVMALQASVKLGTCPPSDLARVLSHYEAIGLPHSPLSIRSNWEVEALMSHMAHDKKAQKDGLTFILSRGIGQSYIAEKTDELTIRQVLAEACGRV